MLTCIFLVKQSFMFVLMLFKVLDPSQNHLRKVYCFVVSTVLSCCRLPSLCSYPVLRSSVCLFLQVMPWYLLFHCGITMSFLDSPTNHQQWLNGQTCFAQQFSSTWTTWCDVHSSFWRPWTPCTPTNASDSSGCKGIFSHLTHQTPTSVWCPQFHYFDTGDVGVASASGLGGARVTAPDPSLSKIFNSTPTQHTSLQA